MSLTKLEKALADGKSGVKELTQIFNSLCLYQGRLDGLEDGLITGTDEEVGKNFCTRLCAAFCQILTSSNEISVKELEQLMLLRNYIDLCFSLSSFYTSDHILGLVPDGEFVQILTALTVNSKSSMNFDEAFQLNKEATVLALLQFCTSRFILSERAFKLKEMALKWLPAHLDEVRIGYGMLARVAEVYMHCSYASFKEKHDIKAPLLRQLRTACLKSGCEEMSEDPERSERPTIIVISEQFLPSHVTWRTHSQAIRSLRERFKLVSLNFPVDYPNEDRLFAEIIPTPNSLELFQQVKFCSTQILAKKPVAIFFLGVGMCPQSISLASLRLAPIQFTSYGHTASTFSEEMDFFILPEAFVKSEEVFTEKLVKLPMRAFPYTEHKSAFKEIGRTTRTKIAVCASAMKLNPSFLACVKRIMSEVDAEIHFFPFAARGLIYLQLKDVIEKGIRNSTVWPELSHEDYLSQLSSCDFLISPFPYGNMNSIMDGFALGLPTVCLSGEEPHSHADSAFLKRIGLDLLSTESEKQYEHVIKELCTNREFLSTMKAVVKNSDLDKLFYSGDAKLFCDAVLYLVNRYVEQPQDHKRLKLG